MVDDPTFPYRVAFGLTVFGVLGVIDAVRNPQNPERLKEYAFLFAVTVAAMLYGLVHDATTFSLSPEYFSAVKGLRAPSFFPDVAQLALRASWTVGLAIGLTFLIANNPCKQRPQLPYSRLARHLGWPIVAAPTFAAFLAVASMVAPQWSSRALGVTALEVQDFGTVAMVWAVHLGTYSGAAVGLVAAVARIRNERGQLAATQACSSTTR